MKLRNKKTGEIVDAEAREDGIYVWDKLTLHLWKKSLEELAEEYEYYIKPYIKDDKIRKFVRDWATFNKIEKACIQRLGGEESWYKVLGQDELKGTWTIQIHAYYPETVSKDYDGHMVGIHELCGEYENNEDDEDSEEQRSNEY